jgi:hypothetical protein
VNASQRDAIIVSGWNWEAFNVPERVALALAHAGVRVLYCQNPVSLFRHVGRPLSEIEKGIFAFGPEFIGHRLNSLPLLPQLQSNLLANQILRKAATLMLQDPIFIYAHGEYVLPLCREFKKRGFSLVHICMDFPEEHQDQLIRLSDLTLVIPSTVFHMLRNRFGEKVRLLPQLSSLHSIAEPTHPQGAPELSGIPRPRLGYLGNMHKRVSLTLLEELLSNNPEWHFVSFGITKHLSLKNEHILPWRSPREMSAIIDGLDVGFMPYDCLDNKNLHCFPLKLFDYFSVGMPVVSTRVLNLLDYSDVIYFGDTADELSRAITLALAEPKCDARRAKRVEIASEHSLEKLSHNIGEVLAIL